MPDEQLLRENEIRFSAQTFKSQNPIQKLAGAVIFMATIMVRATLGRGML